MQQQQQYTREHLSHPASLILAILMQGPRHAVALCEVMEQVESVFIEPATLYRVLAQLEQRDWVETLETEGSLRPYRITTAGMHALQSGETNRHWTQQGEKGHHTLRRGKEFIMRLVLWIVCLYPRGWRERYEAEMVALLEQHHITFWTVLDLFLGAVDARLDPHYRQARPLLHLRRFQSSWRLAIAAFAIFWIALLPWLWMGVLGLSPGDTDCNSWPGNHALCMMRVGVGLNAPSLTQAILQLFLALLPLLLIAFTVTLVVARGKHARTHLLLAGMVAFSIGCGLWLSAIWPLFPQIDQFYPQTPPALLAGLVGMGVATILALVALVRAAFALKALVAASSKQEPSSLPLEEHETTQVDGTLSWEHPAASPNGAGNVSKGWMIVLGVLVLLFIFPWPDLLLANDSRGWNWMLVIWACAALVGIITALLVKSPGNVQLSRTAQKPGREISPMIWVAILPIPSILVGLPMAFLSGFGPLSPLLTADSVAGLVSGVTALIIFIRSRRPRLEIPLRVCIIVGTAMLFIFLVTLSRSAWMAIGSLLLGVFICALPAFFVRVRRVQKVQTVHSDNQQADFIRERPQSGNAPKVWGIFLLTLLLVNILMQVVGFFLHIFIPFRFIPTLLLFLIAICIIPAVAVKARQSTTQGDATAQPSRNVVTPKVWILILPIWFLSICIQSEFTIGQNYNSYEEVLVAWILTGLAGLIVLLTVKIGSRERKNFPIAERIN